MRKTLAEVASAFPLQPFALNSTKLRQGADMRNVAAALAVTLLVSGIAQAKQIGALQQIGAWRVGAYSNDATQGFSHCDGTSAYKSGILLGMSVSPDLRWAISLANAQWSLTNGDVYPVQVSVDGKPLGALHFIALAPTYAGALLPSNSPLFAAMRAGQFLHLKALGQDLDFELADSAQMLDEVMNCVRRNSPQVASSNPFVAPPPPTAAPAPGRPQQAAAAPPPAPSSQSGPTAEEKLEGIRQFANLAAAGAFPAAKLLPESEVPPMFRERIAVWFAGRINGSLQIVRPGELGDADAISRKLLTNAATICRKGTFASGAEADPDADVRHVYSACEAGKEKTYTRYFVMPRGAGGHYVISLHGFDDPAEVREAATRLRDAGVAVLTGRVPERSRAQAAPAATGRAAGPSQSQIDAAHEVLAGLARAGAFPGTKLLQGSEIPDSLRNRLAVWKGPFTYGAMDMLTAQEASDPDAIAQALIADAAARCHNAVFGSGSIPDPDMPVRRVFVGCEEERNPQYVRYFIMPTGNGGYYIFALYGVAPDPVREAEDLLRETVFAAVKGSKRR